MPLSGPQLFDYALVAEREEEWWGCVRNFLVMDYNECEYYINLITYYLTHFFSKYFVTVVLYIHLFFKKNTDNLRDGIQKKCETV